MRWAEELYGSRWQDAVHAAGLARQRRKVDGMNKYFYQLQLPGCHRVSSVSIKAHTTVGAVD